jgi:hypothetical protein
VLLQIPDHLFVVYRIVMEKDGETLIVLNSDDDEEFELSDGIPYLICKVGDASLSITEKSVVNGRLRLRGRARGLASVPKATEPAVNHPADDPRGALLALGAAWIGRTQSRPLSIAMMLRKAGVPCYVDCWFVDQRGRGDNTPKLYSKSIETALRGKLKAHEFTAGAVQQLGQNIFINNAHHGACLSAVERAVAHVSFCVICLAGLSDPSSAGCGDWIMTSQEHVDEADNHLPSIGGWITLEEVNNLALSLELTNNTAAQKAAHQIVHLLFRKEQNDEQPLYVMNTAI